MNGEILGVSLLLEDVLQNGLPDIFNQQSEDSSSLGGALPRSRPNTSTSRRPPSRQGGRRESVGNVGDVTADGTELTVFGDIPKGTLSFSTNPKAAVKLINLFLVICSRLELLKMDWGCRKLDIKEIANSKLYRAFW